MARSALFPGLAAGPSQAVPEGAEGQAGQGVGQGKGEHQVLVHPHRVAREEVIGRPEEQVELTVAGADLSVGRSAPERQQILARESQLQQKIAELEKQMELLEAGDVDGYQQSLFDTLSKPRSHGRKRPREAGFGSRC